MNAPETIRVAGVVSDSIVDGPGLRLAVFTQGCPHHCDGCHNPHTHDPTGGQDMPIADIALSVQKNPLLAGVTLTGGEPLAQASACQALVKRLPAGCNVWVYSGWTWEALLQEDDPGKMALLRACDVLVDGPFAIGQRSLSCPYRGSTNQRLVDLRKTFAAGALVLWEPPG